MKVQEFYGAGLMIAAPLHCYRVLYATATAQQHTSSSELPK